MLEKAFMKAVGLPQEQRDDVVAKLHKHYAKQMYHLLDLVKFERTIIN